MNYRAGIDWSGDSGNPRKKGSLPYLSIALVEVEEECFAALESCVTHLRKTLRLRAGYVFHYTNSPPQVRDGFFSRIGKAPIFAHVSVPDKGLWLPADFDSTTGTERIDGCIVDLICAAMQERPGGRNLTIDGSRSEQTTLAAARKAISDSVKSVRGQRIAKVRFGPDDGIEGALLQTADMIAGAARDGENGSRYLERLRKKLTIV